MAWVTGVGIWYVIQHAHTQTHKEFGSAGLGMVQDDDEWMG
ncbi:uncharacterized protein FTOL_12249 [Fusarium torulosum]|uniref:Uncharacterized protein n=1 Tax=Fusarium torulosum TaxID=33205 RepID=A0AAE8MKD6_9HYPO|nr:uncharacterized protein FTOL_12249 [Fusarium torulosum]